MAKFLVFIVFIFPVVSLAQDSLSKDFEKVELAVGVKKISAFVADDVSKRSRGLMNVKSLPLDTGMIFVFEAEQELTFWMKNTLVPLSIGFFDAEGVLVDMQEMKVVETMILKDFPNYRSRSPARFALEMPSGWYAQNKIQNGARLRLISSTRSRLLKETLVTRKTSRQ